MKNAISRLLLEIDEAWIAHAEKLRFHNKLSIAEFELEELLFNAAEWLVEVERRSDAVDPNVSLQSAAEKHGPTARRRRHSNQPVELSARPGCAKLETSPGGLSATNLAWMPLDVSLAEHNQSVNRSDGPADTDFSAKVAAALRTSHTRLHRSMVLLQHSELTVQHSIKAIEASRRLLERTP